ncbi:TPA: hypothetical protein N0F65_000679 [Lagenidium giganteum]|uniref:ATP-dependent RNA helicase n=1 Tax=Lagenidium giganteum TaxID=4803 RepID=A0AAV2YTX9_9STRA|nr:TPA: hypothetical protein N0F65_000679 [Lagenidium giganteum]
MRQLPVYQHRQAIVSAVETNQLTIVQGGTGCGKSTCIQHFLCDAALRAAGVGGRNVRIIVTQPRRLAAIKLATVVAQMRQGDELGGGDGVVGSEVGYVIGKERCATSKTRITFVTTDYMVERLIHHPKSLASITHLVLDEVHERTVGVDMLLLLLRLLLPRHPHVRLVIMSATMEAETLFDYFAKRLFKPLRTRAALCVGSSLFPVQHIHLDQLTTPFPRLAQRCAAVMAKLTKQFDQWLTKHLSANSEQSLSAVLQAHDHQLTVATEVVKDLVLQQRLQTSSVNSIQTLYEALSAAVDAASVPHQVHFHVLHSRVELEDQRKAFEIPSSKYAKIILATNIAESSLTIPDVTHVINCGLERQVASLSHNNSHVEVLTTAWCSQASTAQRAGRAGRVQSGIAYNLFPLDFQQRCMCTYATPEILQKPLSRIVLLLKRSMPMLGTPSALLNASLDPPRHENIDEAFEVLTRHQALDCADEELAKITPFGRFCCHFPLSLELCRLLLVSMNVTRNGSRSSAILLHAVVLVAVLSVPDLFQMPSRFHSDTFIDDMKRSMLAKLSADRALWSEPLTVWRLYIELLASHSSTRRPLLWTWLSKWKLSHARFRTLNNLISDLCDRLIQLKQEDRHGFGQMLSDDTIHLLGKLDRFASTQHADRVLIEALTGEDSKALEDDDVHVMRFLLVATFYENLIEANMNEQGPKPSKKKKGKSKKQTDAMQQRDAENQTNTISLKVVKECTDAFATLKPEERCVLFSSLTRDRLPNNIVVSGDKKDIRVTFPVDPINSAVDSMSLAMIVRPSFPISFACFLSDNSAPIELEIVSAPNSAIKLRFRLEKMNELGVLTWMQPNDPDAKVHVSPRSVFSLPVEHLGNTTHIESFRAVYCDVVRTAGAKRLSALCSRCTLLPVGCAGYYAAVTLLRSKGTVSLLTNKQDGGIQAVYVGERKVELPKNKQLANSVLGCINRLRQGFTDLLCTAVDASVRCEDILELCCDSHVRSHEGSSECFEWQAVDLM